MARTPVVHPAVSEGDKPDVFPEALGPVYSVELTTRPDLGSELFDSSFLDNIVIKTNLQIVGRATCFK